MIYNRAESQTTGADLDEPVKRSRKSLWRLPDAGTAKLVWWVYTWPIKFVLTMTIPSPKTFRKMYPLTFFMCIIAIGLNAYMIVWMITVMGTCQRDTLCETIDFTLTISRLHIQHSRCGYGTHFPCGGRLHARRHL